MIQVPTEYELFNTISGMELDTRVSEEEFLQQIQEYEKETAAYELDSQRKEFAFDLMFNRHKLGSDDSQSEDSDDEEGEEPVYIGEEFKQEMSGADSKQEVANTKHGSKEKSGTGDSK